MRTAVGVMVGSGRRRTLPLGAARWTFLADADHGVTLGSAPAVASWQGRTTAVQFVPGTAPDLIATFAGGGRAAVQCVKGSSEYLLANALASVVQGDDTVFALALHLTIDATAAGDTLFSAGLSTDATKFWSVALTGTPATNLRISGRGTGDGATVNSAALPITASVEHVLTLARTSASVRVGIDGSFADLAHNIGSLPALDRVALGGLIRNAFSLPSSISVRRIGLIAGAFTDADDAALNTAWLGK